MTLHTNVTPPRGNHEPSLKTGCQETEGAQPSQSQPRCFWLSSPHGKLVGTHPARIDICKRVYAVSSWDQVLETLIAALQQERKELGLRTPVQVPSFRPLNFVPYRGEQPYQVLLNQMVKCARLFGHSPKDICVCYRRNSDASVSATQAADTVQKPEQTESQITTPNCVTASQPVEPSPASYSVPPQRQETELARGGADVAERGHDESRPQCNRELSESVCATQRSEGAPVPTAWSPSGQAPLRSAEFGGTFHRIL